MIELIICFVAIAVIARYMYRICLQMRGIE